MKKIQTVIALGLFIAMPALAEIGYVNGAKIDKMIVTSDGSYGGCMLHLDKRTEDAVAGCGRSWVSLSCSGVFTTKSDARLLLETAQLAYALDKTVQVRINDAKLHNGYCFADFINIE